MTEVRGRTGLSQNTLQMIGLKKKTTNPNHNTLMVEKNKKKKIDVKILVFRIEYFSLSLN